VIRAILDSMLARRKVGGAEIDRVSNTGLLVASGLIAGEALTGVILAVMVLGREVFPWLEFPKLIENGSGWAMLLIFAVVAWALIALPLRVLKKPGLPA
jgi:hypothetical protein